MICIWNYTRNTSVYRTILSTPIFNLQEDPNQLHQMLFLIYKKKKTLLFDTLPFYIFENLRTFVITDF